MCGTVGFQVCITVITCSSSSSSSIIIFIITVEGGIVVGSRLVNNLRHADDITLICSSKDDLTDPIDRVTTKVENGAFS